jgi:pilus assembly protein Flp/PilA
MRFLHRLLARLAADTRGASAIEYGLIAAVIGGVVITAATGFGNSLTSAYSTIGSTLVAKTSSM